MVSCWGTRALPSRWGRQDCSRGTLRVYARKFEAPEFPKKESHHYIKLQLQHQLKLQLQLQLVFDSNSRSQNSESTLRPT